MGKINKRKEVEQVRLAGGNGAVSANQSYTDTLKRLVMANLLWEDIAYIDGVSVTEQIDNIVPKCPAEDVYNIARDARLLQKLRHTPLYLAVLMCKYDNTRQYVEKLLPEIITRADMLMDFLAIYWEKNGNNAPIANAAKRGLVKAFHNFTEYQFAKYVKKGMEITLRDVMFICHPKPVDDTEVELFKKIADNTLGAPDTWEVALSRGSDKRETWTRLINEHKLGGLAMLRNIKNMMRVGVEKNIIDKGISELSNKMLLPVDFIKTYMMCPEFGCELSAAMVNSYNNLTKLTGKTLFILDVSGSMDCPISSRSKFSRVNAAIAMAILAANQCENFSIVLTAGDDCTYTGKHEWLMYPEKDLRLIDTVIERMRYGKNNLGGGGIYTAQCLEWCKENVGTDFDRIIVFSDSQDCDRKGNKIEPFGKRNYIVDVSCHTHGINYSGVWDAEISGWSEHFLTYIACMEGIEENNFES